MRNSVVFLFHIQKLQWHHGEPVVGTVAQCPSWELCLAGPSQAPDLWLVWPQCCVVLLLFPIVLKISEFPLPTPGAWGAGGWACSSFEASVVWMFLQPEKASKTSPKSVMLSLNSVFHVLIPFPKVNFICPIVKITSSKLQQLGVPCHVLWDWSVELS